MTSAMLPTLQAHPRALSTVLVTTSRSVFTAARCALAEDDYEGDLGRGSRSSPDCCLVPPSHPPPLPPPPRRLNRREPNQKRQ
jgi:hypothetical protein